MNAKAILTLAFRKRNGIKAVQSGSAQKAVVFWPSLKYSLFIQLLVCYNVCEIIKFYIVHTAVNEST
jgi:hypothetical protein